MTTAPVRRTTIAAIAVLSLLLAGALGFVLTVGVGASVAHQTHSASRVHPAADSPTPSDTQAPDNTAWE